MTEALLAALLVALPAAATDAAAHVVTAIGVFIAGTAVAVGALVIHNAWDSFWESV